mmetsp:Transcript_10779/g.37435  ORF Transcript_10779/g.37435 Transcript_10779/m.37435 type:complete len:205 (-) Transcript_10779:319-933(-)
MWHPFHGAIGITPGCRIPFSALSATKSKRCTSSCSTILASRSARCCPRQFLGPSMNGRKSNRSWLGGPPPSPCMNLSGLNSMGSGHMSSRWCTPCMTMITVVPRGTAQPPRTSSCTHSLVTTGTTLYLRSASFSAPTVYSSVSRAALLGLAAGSPPFPLQSPNTGRPSARRRSIFSGAETSSWRAHVSMDALVSWPASTNVLIS